MRAILAAAATALLLANAPASAQQGRSAANDPANPANWDVTPTTELIGKTVMHRFENRPVGTVRSIVRGDDGTPMLAVRLAEGNRTVLLGPADVERRGERIQLMLEPERLAAQPDYTGPATSGSSQ
ncbi:MAG TPA: hypothetical protein VD995_09280 [Azospirillum sp.]|nr:hypothetical protein [Azospirillum sp.]